MTRIVTYIIAVLLSSTMSQADQMISSSDIVKAFRLYRQASEIITKLHNSAYYSEDSYSESDEPINDLPKLSPSEKVQYLKARSLLLNSVKLNAYNPEPFMYLGMSYMEVEKDYEKAFNYFSKALVIDPHYEAILTFRFDMSIRLNRYDMAKDDLATLKVIKSPYYDSCKEELKLVKKP